jgi:glycosyltransferase involved in cell wall biosynthesis
MEDINLRSFVLLFDWRLGEKKFWLQNELEKKGHKVFPLGIPGYDLKNRTIKWRKIVLWWQYFKLGWQGSRLAHKTKSDIIAWNFIAGVFASLFFPAKSQRVLALNMITYEKGRINQLVRRLIYNRAFFSRRVIGTINSKNMVDKYLKHFKIQQDQLFELHDSWSANYEVVSPKNEDEGFIFSGGESARDWETLLEVANKLLFTQFKIVARRKYWVSSWKVPPNVSVIFDLDDEEYYNLVKRSRLVLLPLKGIVTAGLIVLIRSILLGKVVITTETPSIVPYYPKSLTNLLTREGDVEQLTLLATRYLNNDDLRIKTAIEIQQYVLTEYSPEKFTSRLLNMINKR